MGRMACVCARNRILVTLVGVNKSPADDVRGGERGCRGMVVRRRVYLIGFCGLLHHVPLRLVRWVICSWSRGSLPLPVPSS
jgi:hypothetical protein